jgi:hypothetical protein
LLFLKAGAVQNMAQDACSSSGRVSSFSKRRRVRRESLFQLIPGILRMVTKVFEKSSSTD